MKLILFFLIICTVTGCVGIQSSKKEITEASYNKKYEYNSTKYIKSEYGVPWKINNLDNGLEEWIYSDGVHFSGVVIYLGIPIPLVIPTGTHKTIFVIKDDFAISRETHKHKGFGESFIGCGFFPLAMHGSPWFCTY